MEVANHLGGHLSQELLQSLSLVLGRVIPLKETLYRAQVGRLFLQSLQIGAQGLNDINCDDYFAPGGGVGVHHPLVVKEGQDHLLAPPSMGIGLNWAWCPLIKPLL
jgi:hypothetical protein